MFFILALRDVALRLWARHLTKREMALNDWAVVKVSVKISILTLYISAHV